MAPASRARTPRPAAPRGAPAPAALTHTALVLRGRRGVERDHSALRERPEGDDQGARQPPEHCAVHHVQRGRLLEGRGQSAVPDLAPTSAPTSPRPRPDFALISPAQRSSTRRPSTSRASSPSLVSSTPRASSTPTRAAAPTTCASRTSTTSTATRIPAIRRPRPRSVSLIWGSDPGLADRPPPCDFGHTRASGQTR